MAELITEATMVVTITRSGYVKRTAADVYRAQRRGGKGLKGASVDEEDPIEHLFVASTHDWLLVFTTLGKVFSMRVFELPELARDSKGRALVNLLEFEQGEKVADCRAVGGFEDPNQFLMLATRSGVVKKTALEQYRRRRTKGLIAVKLREGDELVDAVITKPGDELVLATAKGMAIRFPESDARPMGRDTSGVRGIKLGSGDRLVGMVVADPDATLLTVCTTATASGRRSVPARRCRGPRSVKAGARRATTPRRSRRLPRGATMPMATAARAACGTAPSGAGARESATSRPRPATGRWCRSCRSATTTRC